MKGLKILKECFRDQSIFFGLFLESLDASMVCCTNLSQNNVSGALPEAQYMYIVGSSDHLPYTFRSLHGAKYFNPTYVNFLSIIWFEPT